MSTYLQQFRMILPGHMVSKFDIDQGYVVYICNGLRKFRMAGVLTQWLFVHPSVMAVKSWAFLLYILPKIPFIVKTNDVLYELISVNQIPATRLNKN